MKNFITLANNKYSRTLFMNDHCFIFFKKKNLDSVS